MEFSIIFPITTAKQKNIETSLISEHEDDNRRGRDEPFMNPSWIKLKSPLWTYPLRKLHKVSWRRDGD